MTDHETFLLLAAKEIHEGLSADESTVLQRHLVSCPACRAFANEMRRDDARLRAALVETPVGADVLRTVLDAAAGRPRRGNWLPLAIAATLLLGIIGVGSLVGGDRSPISGTLSPSPSAGSASSSPTSASASGGSVNGAYAYTVGPEATRRDSVSAQFEGGLVGEWSRMIPATSGGSAFGGPVTCLVIDGRDAWLAGPATSASDGSTDRAAFLYVHDGGPDGNGDTAVLWMNDPGQTLATLEGWCSSRFIPAGPYPLDDGDVTVVPGTN